MSSLPKGWANAKLAEVGELVSGAGFPEAVQNQTGLPYPFFKVGNLAKVESGKPLLESDHTVDDEIARALGARIIPRNAIAFAKIGMAIRLNRRRLIGAPSCIDNNMMAVIPTEAILPCYLLRFLETIDFMPLTQSTTVPALRKSDLEALDLSLPPLNEQRRLVAKLETVLSRVNAAHERLATIPIILKRFRRAVLASEFESNADMNSKGVSEIFSVQTGGTPNRKNPAFYTNGDVPWVRTGEVQNCEIFKSDEFITKEALRNSNAKLFPPGTLLIAMYGEGKTRGQVARLRIEASTNQACAALVNPELSAVSNQYVFFFLLGQYYKLRSKAVGGNQPNLNLSTIKSWKIPFPSETEQQNTVRRVEALFKRADTLEARYLKAKGHVDKLTQSVLAKAFRGELVPQDPTDEPASVLLERIKQNRNGNEASKRRTRK
jgi:type I restriction enzyme, S subunit